jgi:hypothetical protein
MRRCQLENFGRYELALGELGLTNMEVLTSALSLFGMWVSRAIVVH